MNDLLLSPVLAGAAFGVSALAFFVLHFVTGPPRRDEPRAASLALAHVASFVALIATCGWLYWTHTPGTAVRRAATQGVPVAAIVARCDRIAPFGSLDDCVNAGIRRYEFRGDIAAVID